MKPELTLAGIPRLDPPDCGEAEHKAAQGNPPHRYIALDRVVMQGQVFICRAPSHEKAKKLARMFNAWPVVVESLRLALMAEDGPTRANWYGRGQNALRLAEDI